MIYQRIGKIDDVCMCFALDEKILELRYFIQLVETIFFSEYLRGTLDLSPQNCFTKQANFQI